MTYREEIKAKIDALSEAELQEIAELLETREAKHHAEAAASLCHERLCVLRSQAGTGFAEAGA